MNYTEAFKRGIKEEQNSERGNLMPQKIQFLIKNMLNMALNGLTPEEMEYINTMAIDTIGYDDINDILSTEYERVILSKTKCQACKNTWSTNKIKITNNHDLYICNECLNKIKIELKNIENEN